MTSSRPVLLRMAGALPCVLLLALATGCGSSSDSSGPTTGATTSMTTQPTASSTTTGQPTSAPSPSSKTASPQAPAPASGESGGVVTAGDTALAKVSGGTVISIDAERGNTVWEVQIVTSDGQEHEVYVSWDGKTVQSGPTNKHEDAEDRAENKQKVSGAQLDYQQAAEHVTKARKGTITELNLDTEGGKVIWESDVRDGSTKYEVTIDATSGKVLKNSLSR